MRLTILFAARATLPPPTERDAVRVIAAVEDVVTKAATVMAAAVAVAVAAMTAVETAVIDGAATKRDSPGARYVSKPQSNAP